MRKSILTVFITLFIAINFSACSLYKVDSQETAADYYPAKKSIDQVAYLERIDRLYQIIGTVTVNTERVHSLDEILDKMKREAALLGGDAITDLRTDAGGMWKRLPAQKLIGNAYVRANYIATVVVFK